MKNFKLFFFSIWMIVALPIHAGPDLFSDAPITTLAIPTLGAGEYGTDVDNENNARTGVADDDMDTYIFNSNANHPIEYNISLPNSAAGAPGTLRMDVFDVDTNTQAGNPEIDEVYVNGKKVGVLNGANDIWGVNQFSVGPGILKGGKNLVQIQVDKGNRQYWAVQIDWGIIKVQPNRILINRAWVAPALQNRNNFVNFFAEVTGSPKEVNVYGPGNVLWVKLTDPDGDRTWSGQWKIPAGSATGYLLFTMRAYNQNNVIVSRWPYLQVTP